ncbi:MAG TPA: cytidylate kinase-like family protein [Candidatus Acetatifactor stercoripullorum]|uniref:Cytidylate kinase-like family protein n=1 Tax=Candidatus Acetatifactor stercoripullorum TaxID=2838414 RepID=A0A9D1R1R3_9FIRM|nr:cytidylate kinase-like family protein [Candidatus Acetatifactor stercoripullorum]HIW80091.1 cytidylate kinase-like family protein [Candidatus Acetatifactor stercoripullorum]
MKGQLIISIGREFGSGGHEIAQKLADQYKLPLYDHNLLDELAGRNNLDGDVLKEFDEAGRKKLLSRTVRGMNNSPEQNVAQLQFDYLRKKADSGESFVIVGRCSETILKGNTGLISIFVLGDMETKIERIMRLYQKSRKDAEELILEKDRKRKKYHNSHCRIKWGDSRNYDLSINSSRLGIEESVRILSQYIDARRKMQEAQ